ncbi:2,5-didehydrogluconate reductase [Neocallimastix lanati (nom. inval.)]|nr:2,5-didehydrogluconate reductase [Neocallimastix sp. JGI-2020a]
MSQQSYITLNNSVKIPQFGLGVYLVDGDDTTEKTVVEALKLGYCHIDTAHAYFNERGSGIPRDEIFVTSKLWPTEFGEGVTYPAVIKMLKRLQLEYIDMVLLHHPMKDCKVKAIGISNFEKAPETLENVLKIAKIKPAVCQSECHPYHTQQKLREILAPHKSLVEAYYPIGHGDKNLLNEAIFTKLAKKYNKTNVQIILRWHIQYGNIVIPKTTNPVHLKENIKIFDFELTPEEMKTNFILYNVM